MLDRQMGLDRPLSSATSNTGQCAARRLRRVDRSIVDRSQKSLWDRLGNTLLLAAICFAVIVPFSVLFGVLAGMRERSIGSTAAFSVFSSICASIPEFAMGVFLLAIFVVWLGVLPGTSPLSTERRLADLDAVRPAGRWW